MMTVGVVGAGTMGNGIAQVFAQAGHQVRLSDVKQEFLDRGMDAIRKSLARFVQKQSMTEQDREAALGRITCSPGLAALADHQLIVEAITEDLAA